MRDNDSTIGLPIAMHARAREDRPSLAASTSPPRTARETRPRRVRSCRRGTPVPGSSLRGAAGGPHTSGSPLDRGMRNPVLYPLRGSSRALNLLEGPDPHRLRDDGGLAQGLCRDSPRALRQADGAAVCALCLRAPAVPGPGGHACHHGSAPGVVLRSVRCAGNELANKELQWRLIAARVSPGPETL